MRSKYINQGRRPLRLGLPLSDTTLLYTHTGAAADCCVAWVEPLEAQDALAQAQQQRPAARLAIATLPLGKAFALSEGWAEAEGVAAFRVQAHSPTPKPYP